MQIGRLRAQATELGPILGAGFARPRPVPLYTVCYTSIVDSGFDLRTAAFGKLEIGSVGRGFNVGDRHLGKATGAIGRSGTGDSRPKKPRQIGWHGVGNGRA